MLTFAIYLAHSIGASNILLINLLSPTKAIAHIYKNVRNGIQVLQMAMIYTLTAQFTKSVQYSIIDINI